MSELAFDKEGNPFRFSRRAKKLRPRRWKNAGQRGTCAAVLDPDGEPLFIDVDAEYVEFRAAVGNVPGFYRLDQCDEDGSPVEDAPPAYVSIESTRNAAPTGEADPRDAIIRDLAQINADMTRTIAERFGNVMQSTADILRAADGAGLSRREPPPPPPPIPPAEEDEDEEEEEETEDDGSEPVPPESPFGPLQPFVEMAMPHLPKFGAFLWMKFQEFMKQNETPAPAATSSAAPAPAPATAPAAAPSAAPAPGDVAAGPSAWEPVPASAPVPAPAPAPAPPPVPATAPISTSVPVVASAPVAAPGSAPVAPTTAPAAAVPFPPASSRPVAAAASESPTLDSAASNTTAITGAPPAGPAQIDVPRNAPPIEPTPEQWEHLLAIRARLSPREAAIAETVVTRMDPDMRALWLAELSVLSVDRAVDFVRSMIPEPPRRQPTAKNGAKDHGKEGEG